MGFEHQLTRIESVETLNLDHIRRAAQLEGIRTVERLTLEISDVRVWGGKPGVGLWVATSVESGLVIAMGGITVCPTNPEFRRVRRFYVHPAWRRQGVGRAIAQLCIAKARQAGIRVVTCNAAASSGAPLFWEVMGFLPTFETDVTHRYVLEDTGGSRGRVGRRNPGN